MVVRNRVQTLTVDAELAQRLEALREQLLRGEFIPDVGLLTTSHFPTLQDGLIAQQLDKAYLSESAFLLPAGLDEASRRLVENVWNLMLSGRSSRVRRSWHVNFILLRRLSWLNPIIRPAINLIRQELRQLRWEIVPLRSEARGRVMLAYRLLLNPNPMTSWGEWLDKMLEDSLALDAAVSEIWTARYIPFTLTIPQLVLPKLEEEERKRTRESVPSGGLEFEELIGLQKQKLTDSLIHTRNMAEAVLRERLHWLEEAGLIKASQVRRYIEIMTGLLQKAQGDLVQAYRIMFEEHEEILKKTIGGTEDEIRLDKASLHEPAPIPYPMDLPLALIPIPGEQIEFQGDIYAMVEDPYFPYLRVVNGVPIRAYQRDELMYVKENPRTWSFYGLSPIECVVIVSHVMLYAHDVQFRYFLTGSVPAAIVGVVGGGNVSELRAYINEVARGKQEAIAVIDVPPNGNLIVQRLAETNRELQYIQLLEWYARLICIAFGLQPWELGILAGGTPSRRLLRQRPGIYGRFITWEDAINFHILQKGFKLLPQVDAVFRFVNKDIGDFGEEAAAVGNLVREGIITRNEARHRLGYPPLVGGLPDHAYTVTGQALLLHGKSPSAEKEELEIPSIPSPVGFWVPPPVGGVGLPTPTRGRGKTSPLAGILGLAKSLPSVNLEKYDDELKTAMKIFARALVADGKCESMEEGYKVAVALKEGLERQLGRSLSKGEWIAQMRAFLDYLWEVEWKAEWDELMRKAEEADIIKMIGEPPVD